MILRSYERRDCPALARLFFDTVHTVNRRDYTQAQVDAWATGEVDLAAWDAWATGEVDLAAWDASLAAHRALVAEEDGVILGFADMADDGYLDRLYVHKDHQNKGIATALCDALEGASGAARFTTHASLTARPFFEGRGYRVVRTQQVERRGVRLPNFVMEKAN